MSDKFYTYKKEDNQKHASLQEYSTINAEDEGVLNLGVPTATPITPINNNIKHIEVLSKRFNASITNDLDLSGDEFSLEIPNDELVYRFDESYYLEDDLGYSFNGYCSIKIDIGFKESASVNDVATWYNSIDDSFTEAFVYDGYDQNDSYKSCDNDIIKAINDELEDTTQQTLFKSNYNIDSDGGFTRLSSIGIKKPFYDYITDNNVVNNVYVTVYIWDRATFYRPIYPTLTNNTGMLLGFNNNVFLNDTFEIILNEEQSRLEISYKKYNEFNDNDVIPTFIAYYVDNI